MFDLTLNSKRSRFRAAMVLAIAADALQIVAFPLFADGAISPFDDLLDFIVALSLTRLVGWHWEFAVTHRRTAAWRQFSSVLDTRGGQRLSEMEACGECWGSN
jgi:hypothetical protein